MSKTGYTELITSSYIWDVKFIMVFTEVCLSQQTSCSVNTSRFFQEDK